MSREQLFAAFFFAAFLFLLYQLYLFVQPFLVPFVWAAILALAFYPLTTWLVRVFRGRRSLAAFVLVLAVTVVAILPTFYFGSVLVGQATDAYRGLQMAVRDGELPALETALRDSPVGGLWLRVAPYLDRYSVDPTEALLRATNWLSDQIVGQATRLARNVLGSVVNFLLMTVALFFFFRDGEAIANRVRELLPMQRAHKDVIFSRLYTTTTAVVQSMVLTAATQGILAGLGYWLIGGLTLSVFLGFLTALASFVPVAGAALVWSSSAAYLMLTGELARGVALAIWGALAVSTADNWIKPIFIGGRAQLPTFPLLIALLGGLQVYGVLGVFVGPVMLAILFAFLDIYGELYRERPVLVAEPEQVDRAASG